MSERDILFLLPGAFEDAAAGPGMFHCPHCARISGLLSYAPALRERIEVRIVPFPRPRAAVAELLGPEHPGCPVLVLADATAAGPDDVRRSPATGRAYIEDTSRIIDYLARRHGAPRPHP